MTHEEEEIESVKLEVVMFKSCFELVSSVAGYQEGLFDDKDCKVLENKMYKLFEDHIGEDQYSLEFLSSAKIRRECQVLNMAEAMIRLAREFDSEDEFLAAINEA